MSRFTSRLIGLIMSLVSVCALFSQAAAQTLINSPFPEQLPAFGLHYQQPNFSGDDGYVFPSGAIEASAYLPLGTHYFAYAMLPIGMYVADHEADSSHWRTSGIILGNVGVGFGHRVRLSDQLALANSAVVRANTTPESHSPCCDAYWAMYAAWYADPFHGERFERNYWSIFTVTQVAYDPSPFYGMEMEFRPMAMFPDGSWGHVSTWINGGTAVHAGGAGVQGIAEYVFTWWAGGYDLKNFSFRYDDAAGLGLRVVLERVTLTGYYHIVLNDRLRAREHGQIGFKVEGSPAGAR